ncbi:MAG: hypothetical protein AAFY56_20160, partial [Pseudomonadota bacterium]
MRNKFAIFAGALMGATSLAASAQEPVTLQWQTANLTEDQFQPILEQLLAEFHETNPNIRIEPIPVARKDH